MKIIDFHRTEDKIVIELDILDQTKYIEVDRAAFELWTEKEGHLKYYFVTTGLWGAREEREAVSEIEDYYLANPNAKNDLLEFISSHNITCNDMAHENVDGLKSWMRSERHVIHNLSWVA